MKVVVDTNAWLLPVLDQTDVFAEIERLLGLHEAVVASSTWQELNTLADGEGKRAVAARTAMRLAKRATRAKTDLPGDDGVLDVARRLEAAVVTNDKRLAKEARRSGLRVLSSRGAGRLHEVA